jgi:hypothetical protein
MRYELGCGIIVAADRSNLAILVLGIQQVCYRNFGFHISPSGKETKRNNNLPVKI